MTRNRSGSSLGEHELTFRDPPYRFWGCAMVHSHGPSTSVAAVADGIIQRLMGDIIDAEDGFDLRLPARQFCWTPDVEAWKMTRTVFDRVTRRRLLNRDESVAETACGRGMLYRGVGAV